MNLAPVRITLGVLLLSSAASAQEDACDHLENPKWIQWDSLGWVDASGSLLSLNLDDSGSSDLVLLPSTLVPTIPQVLLDVDLWNRGGGLNQDAPMLDMACLPNAAGRDLLLCVDGQKLTQWSLSAEGDSFERMEWTGPWAAAQEIEARVDESGLCGILAVLDAGRSKLHLQARMLEDPASFTDLASLNLPGSVSDFALIDFFEGDGLPELALLDSRGLLLFDLAGNQLAPPIAPAGAESLLGQLTPLERGALLGQDIVWLSELGGVEQFNHLQRSGQWNQIALTDLSVQSMQLVDLDGNGLQDLALLDSSKGLFWMINVPGLMDGSFLKKDLIQFEAPLAPTPFTTTDLDHDGDLDLIADGMVFHGSQLDPSFALPVVDPESFRFEFDRTKGPGGDLPPQNGFNGRLPADQSKDGPRLDRRRLRDPGSDAIDTENAVALIGNVTQVRFDLLSLGILPPSVTELKLEVYAARLGSNELLESQPVASAVLPVASKISLQLTPLDDVDYHYFILRPRRVISGAPTWSLPPISFRWRPLDGTDSQYSQSQPGEVCSTESARLGRSGPVPVIPVTFLGSWPSYY